MAKPLVYVVDDNVSARSSVCALLATFDYEVRAFDSAESFLAADDKTEPACLLCDVRLPGMSGVQLHRTRKLRGIGLPVILISGYLDSDMVAEALENARGSKRSLRNRINFIGSEAAPTQFSTKSRTSTGRGPRPDTAAIEIA